MAKVLVVEDDPFISFGLTDQIAQRRQQQHATIRDESRASSSWAACGELNRI